MARVHVWGASGYAAAETIAYLVRHPFVELGVLESASGAGEKAGSEFPRLRKLERVFDPPGSVLKAIQADEIVIMGGPNGAAKEVAPDLLASGARVIDLSADFRLAPASAVYGFPERYRAQIARARLVANPGCYPTATLLATLPLATFGVAQIIVDAKSGITGAGRKPAVHSLYAEVANEIRAYGLQGHRHAPEIEQEFAAAGIQAPLTFTPHVVPLVRGLLADAYCIFHRDVDERAVFAAFNQSYDGNPFVRLMEEGQAPSVAAVAETNDAEIGVSVHGNIVRSICAIDNLGKGAAGQAVQNLNIMLGYAEDSGLTLEQRDVATR
ncbi:MAG TPA: N-acetyl-gamma-glutamyl-phosphate reductase [Candidatus Rubrimentiphilum sp.]|nr:N-acetyl-gamma-glutamyl-phosphate reductase [Candidatus Rubrimentiphilum sp.]